MTEPKKRGRPKMTEEQKAAKRVAKAGLPAKHSSENGAAQPPEQVPTEETEIARLQAIVLAAEEKMRLQNLPPIESVTPQGPDQNLVQVIPAEEYSIQWQNLEPGS